MARYTYDEIFAKDPSNPQVVAKSASITIFDPADPNKAPVPIFEVTGAPLPNPITVSPEGMGPAFYSETLARVGWYGAGLQNYLTSYEGMFNETVAAKEAADASASAAATAGANAAAVASAAISGAVADAEAAKDAAVAAAGLVGTPADAAIAAAINGGGATRSALSEFVREDATALQGRALFVTSDSFGTILNNITPYTTRVQSSRSMSAVSTSVGGQFFQDGFGRNWGTAATVSPGSPPDSFCLVAFGINPAYHRGDSAPNRAAEKNSFEALLWLLASASIGSDSEWAKTGTWSAYTGGGSENMRGGSAFLTDSPGAYATTTPAAGDYVAIGYSFSAGLGIRGELGQYSKNGTPLGTTYANDITTGAPATPNGSLVIPKARPLLGLNGTDVIRVDRTLTNSGDYMFVDSLIKLSATPPWIIVVKPTYVAADSWFPTTDAEVDAYRADIDSVIASVTAQYAPLRGKIIVVDPVTSGWDRDAHTDADGLHPSDAGHEFLSKLVQRQVAYAVRLRQQLLTTGQLTA